MAIRNLGNNKNISLNKVKGCPLDFLCRYCKPDIMRICCLFNNVLRMGLFRCNNIKCSNNYDCNDALSGLIPLESIPTIRNLAKIHYNVKIVCNGFSSHFIPNIDTSPIKKAQNQIGIIRRVGLDTISLSLSNLISSNNKKIIKGNYLVDLHNLLDFDGKIMLTSNIRDNFCEKLLNNSERYIEELKILKPDIITTFDANFYINQPLFITLFQMKRILKANGALGSLNIDQVCLIPPLVYPFFELMIDKGLQLSYKVLGIPLLEINRERMSRYRADLITSLNWFKKRNTFKSILISTNPNSLLLVDYFSSQSWLKIKNSKNLTSKERARKLEWRLRESIIKSKNAYSQQNIRRFI